MNQPLKGKRMKFSLLVFVAAVIVLMCGSCSSEPASLPQPTVPPEGKPEIPVSKVWKFQANSARALGPLAITLRVSGTAISAPFVWTVTVLDAKEKSLFHVEHDDKGIDPFFGDEGFISIAGCKGYQACKEKWYFEELPKEVGAAVELVDQSNQPVETWQHDELVRLGRDFLIRQGISEERHPAILDEMVVLLAGRFEKLYVPLDPVQEGTTFMYVPSMGVFIPYWRP
jgi:hypothetical protein